MTPSRKVRMYCHIDHPARTAGKRLCDRAGWKSEPLTIPVFQLDMVAELLSIDAAMLEDGTEMKVFVLADV